MSLGPLPNPIQFVNFSVFLYYWLLVSIHCGWKKKYMYAFNLFKFAKTCFMAWHDLNQTELLTEFLGLTGPVDWLCCWGETLAGSQLRHLVCPGLSIGCCKPRPPSLSQSHSVAKPHSPVIPWDNTQNRPPRKRPTTLGSWISSLGSLSLAGETTGPRHTLSVLSWGRCDSIRV